MSSPGTVCNCTKADTIIDVTAFHAVAALQPLRALVKASNVSLAGWTSSSSSLEPCGSPNCSTQQGLGVPECAWEGVACQNGRVTSV